MKPSVRSKKFFNLAFGLLALIILIWDIKIIWDSIGAPGNHLKDYIHPVVPLIVLFQTYSAYKKLKKQPETK